MAALFHESWTREMKSLTVGLFMRNSFAAGLIFAATIFAFDLGSITIPSVGVLVNNADAQEVLSSLTATSPLRIVSADAWDVELKIANTIAEAGAPSIPAPTSLAANEKGIESKKPAPPRSERPTRLIIPSIGVDSPVVPVGVNQKGEMDVPSGSTNNVGWYKDGPTPGQMGSSVLDAHVFAAFKNLKYAKVGEEIFVETESGQRLRFVIEETTIFKLSELTSQMLFGRNDARWLNLITCAGDPIGDTYTHRLVVFAKFIEVI